MAGLGGGLLSWLGLDGASGGSAPTVPGRIGVGGAGIRSQGRLAGAKKPVAVADRDRRPAMWIRPTSRRRLCLRRQGSSAGTVPVAASVSSSAGQVWVICGASSSAMGPLEHPDGGILIGNGYSLDGGDVHGGQPTGW